MASTSNRSRKRSTSNTRTKRSGQDGKGGHPLAWIFTGLCLGLVVAAGIYVYYKAPALRHPHHAKVTQGKTPQYYSSAKPASHHTAPSGRSGRIPHPVPGVSGAKHAQSRTRHTSKPRQYLVQVASFRKYAAANAEKARLALIGLESKIDKHHKHNGHVWYRVRIGPETHSKVKATLKRLSANHYKGLVMPADG